MSNSPLLINEPPLQVLPTLAVQVGLNEAIVLQQIHYWLNPRFNKNVFDERLWVHNTYEQWQRQFPFWSLKTIQRVLNHLEEGGLLHTFMSKEFQKTKFYSLNYDKLQHLHATDFKIRGSLEGAETLSPVRSTCPDRRGQLDPIDQVNLTSSINKDTENTSPENTLLPLPRILPLAAREEEDDDVAKKMIQLWNAVLGENLAFEPSSNRAQRLRTVYGQVFHNLAQWQQFCEKVATTAFLRGEGPNQWKASLDWCLRDGHASSILEGKYDQCLGKPLDKKPDDTASLAAALQAELSHERPEELRDLKQALLLLSGPQLYRHWFKELTFVALTPQKLTLSTPSALVKSRCEERYRLEILKAAQKVFPNLRTFEIVVAQAQEENDEN